jgi:hypothetical protein
MPQGEANGTTVLSEDEVVEVRQRYLTGNYSYGDLAAKFGVRKSTIQMVLNCMNWRWLLRDGEEELLRQVREERSTWR